MDHCPNRGGDLKFIAAILAGGPAYKQSSG